MGSTNGRTLRSGSELETKELAKALRRSIKARQVKEGSVYLPDAFKAIRLGDQSKVEEKPEENTKPLRAARRRMYMYIKDAAKAGEQDPSKNPEGWVFGQGAKVSIIVAQ